MRFKMDFSKLPKCSANPKMNSSRKHPCRHIALQNGRCYYHSGRPQSHGKYTKKTLVEKNTMKDQINEARHLLVHLKEHIDEKE